MDAHLTNRAKKPSFEVREDPVTGGKTRFLSALCIFFWHDPNYFRQFETISLTLPNSNLHGVCPFLYTLFNSMVFLVGVGFPNPLVTHHRWFLNFCRSILENRCFDVEIWISTYNQLKLVWLGVGNLCGSMGTGTLPLRWQIRDTPHINVNRT